MAGRRWEDDEIKILRNGRRLGKTVKQIAAKLESKGFVRTEASIDNKCLMLGFAPRVFDSRLWSDDELRFLKEIRRSEQLCIVQKRMEKAGYKRTITSLAQKCFELKIRNKGYVRGKIIRFRSDGYRLKIHSYWELQVYILLRREFGSGAFLFQGELSPELRTPKLPLPRIDGSSTWTPDFYIPGFGYLEVKGRRDRWDSVVVPALKHAARRRKLRGVDAIYALYTDPVCCKSWQDVVDSAERIYPF